MRHSGIVIGGWVLAAAVIAEPAAAEPPARLHWSGSLGVGYDDNIGNAAQETDVRDSALVTGAVGADVTRRLTLNTALLFRGGLQAEACEAADGLSSGRGTAMVRLSHRPSGAFHAPTLAAWAQVALLEYDSRLRDGHEYRAGFWVGESLTTALSARFGVSASERDGDAAVFDLSTWSADVTVDWSVAGRFTAYGSYQYQDGDVVSSGSVPPKSSHGTGGGPLGGASAGAADDALHGQFAYRIDAVTHAFTLGANLPFSSRFAVDAQVRRVESGFGDSDYRRWQGSVSGLVRF